MALISVTSSRLGKCLSGSEKIYTPIKKKPERFKLLDFAMSCLEDYEAVP
jgi:hypothetical protein